MWSEFFLLASLAVFLLISWCSYPAVLHPVVPMPWMAHPHFVWYFWEKTESYLDFLSVKHGNSRAFSRPMKAISTELLSPGYMVHVGAFLYIFLTQFASCGFPADVWKLAPASPSCVAPDDCSLHTGSLGLSGLENLQFLTTQTRTGWAVATGPCTAATSNLSQLRLSHSVLGAFSCWCQRSSLQSTWFWC